MAQQLHLDQQRLLHQAEQRALAAFDDFGGADKGYLTPRQLKLASLFLLGEPLSASDAARCLSSVRSRRHGRHRAREQHRCSGFEKSSRCAGQGDEVVLQDAFVREMTRHLLRQDPHQRVRDLFRALDVHGVGYLTRDVVLAAVWEAAPALVENGTAAVMFNQADVNGNDKIEFGEFVAIVRAGEGNGKRLSARRYERARMGVLRSLRGKPRE